MQGKWKSAGAIMLSMTVLATALAGCSSNGNTNDGNHSAATSDRTGAAQKPEDFKGTISVWAWDENYITQLADAFNEVYPHIKVEMTNVSSDDYLKKTQTTLASGGELPDIMMAEVGSRGKMFSYDIWENLEKEPYNFDRSSIFEYDIPLVSNDKGEIVALDNAVNPAAIAYRRDLAKQYLGTDDPDSLEAMFPDLDALLVKGQELVEKSGGKVHLFSGIDDVFAIVNGQNPTPVLQDGVLQVTNRMKDTLDNLVKFRDSGVVDKHHQFSPQWNASYAAGTYLFYPAATWSSTYVIKANDPEGEGNWGLMMPPGGPFSWGGSALGISKGSKNKELAWKFLEWCFLTKEGAQVSKDKINVFLPLKEAYEDPQFGSMPDPYFGGQDVGKFWIEKAVPEINLPTLTQYDQVIGETNAFIIDLLNSDRSIDSDKALEIYLKEVKAKLPDVQVK